MAAKRGEKRTGHLEENARPAFCAASISVIIPARNEAQNLPRLLLALQAMPEIGEIFVCDGGSSDQTVAVSRARGAIVVEGARGRGAQQNAGAALARGEILWFLHADALPDAPCGRQIARAIQSGAPGGNFRLRFAARGVWPRIFEWIARLQRGAGIYYGDSGIFVTRVTWQKLGGLQAWPLFEDLDFARRLQRLARREGHQTACCAGRLRVSARRFERAPGRVLAGWLALQIGFELGVSPQVLARFYHRQNKKRAA